MRLRLLSLSAALLLALPAAAFTPPPWTRSANIYEVNVRQFSPDSSFNAVTAQIPRLHKMGVKILWLMPIQPIGVQQRKGELGSYYAVRDYTGINPEFGSLADFKALIATAHAVSAAAKKLMPVRPVTEGRTVRSAGRVDGF